MSEARFFVRDDDVGELTEALRTFVETFVSVSIPVSYQIIPSQLTPECASYLVALQQAHPRLIEFGQHGLHHRMAHGGRELRREFGPERSYAQQRAAITEGLALLHARLGGDTRIEVFTPPQHKFDANTVRAAADAGHRVFSASCYPTFQHQMAYAFGRSLGLSSLRHHGVSYQGGRRPEASITEMSIGIDVDDGKVRKRSPSAVATRLVALGHRVRWVGLMFHHALYGDPKGRAALAEIAGRLAEIGPEHFFRLSALAEMASESASSG